MEPIVAIVVLILLAIVVCVFILPLIAISRANRAISEFERLQSELRTLQARMRDQQSASGTTTAHLSPSNILVEKTFATPAPIAPASAATVHVATPVVLPPPSIPVVASEIPMPPAAEVQTNLPPIIYSEWPDPIQNATANSTASGQAKTPSYREAIAKIFASLSGNRTNDQQVGAASAHSPAISLEERLGAKLPVWLGAIAILLAGVFLMAFAVKQGWFTPRLRVYVASAVSIILIVGGCALRRNYANLAQGLASAGIGIQFAVLLAVSTIFHQHFEFVSAYHSLFAMVGITALAVGLSLYLGPMVAMIGLIGGFATPSLLQLNPQHTTPLFACLLLQQIGASFIGRRSSHWYFPLLALIAVQIYAGFWIFVHWTPEQAPLMGGILLAAVASFLLTVSTTTEESRSNPADAISVSPANSWWAVVPALVLSAILVSRADLNWTNLSLHATLLVGVIAFARLRESYFALFPIAAALSILTLIAKLLQIDASTVPEIDGKLRWGTIGLSVIIALGCVIACRRSRMAVAWATVSSLSIMALSTIPHLMLNQPDGAVRWVWISGILVGIAAIATTLTNYGRPGLVQGDMATAHWLTGFAVTALVAVSVLVQFHDLSMYWYAVGTGLVLVVVAALTYVWKLYVTGNLLVALSAVLALSLINPMTLAEPLTGELYWNRAVMGFGAAIASLVFSGLIVDVGCRGKLAAPFQSRNLPQSMYALASVLLALLLCLLARMGFARAAAPSNTLRWLELSTDIIAFALVGLLVSVIARLSSDQTLRRLSGLFLIGALLAMVVFAGFYFGPLMLPIDVGSWYVINWLSLAFGIPVAVAIAVTIINRGENSVGDYCIRTLICAGAALFFFMHVRHGFWAHTGSLVIRDEMSFHVCEIPTYAFILGAMSGITEILHRRSQSLPMKQAAIGLAAAFGVLVFLLVTKFNPLFEPRNVGETPIVNLLLIVFGAPLIAAAWLAWRFRRSVPQLSLASGIAAVFLLWLLVTTEVRQYFVGGDLTGKTPSQTEWYAYSAAWIVLAMMLLVGGVATRSRMLRWASLVLMLASVAKVFLYDTRELGDLWRVASYFGLGVSLMLVAFVYQRFVFQGARGRVGQLP